MLSSRLERSLQLFPEKQQKLLSRLLHTAQHTVYGQKHGFGSVRQYDDFRKQTPLIRYDELLPFIDRIAAGESDVLWPGRPGYFALSSGTSSGTKHIPVTKASLQSQRRGRLLHAVNFTHRLGLGGVHRGRFLLFADSHHFVQHGNIPAAAISAILSSTLPRFIKNRDFPSPETQQITNYEGKIDAMIRETAGQNITAIVAMPPWLMLFLKRLHELTGKTLSEYYPDFRLLSTSGMSFEPYRSAATELIGGNFTQLQTYPASEGFVGFQYDAGDPSMVLLPDNGIFFEFIPEEEEGLASPHRYALWEVKTGVRYQLVISTNAGLWAYLPGDVVEFVSTEPYRIRLAGRAGHILNAFGEHLTAGECETLLAQCSREFDTPVRDFMLAPVMQGTTGLPHHHWFIEFLRSPKETAAFALRLQELLVQQNLCYRDLVHGKAITRPRITVLPENGFARLMEWRGKTGVQQKTNRFADEKTAAFLEGLK